MLSKKTEKQDKNYLILSINRMILAEPIFLSLQWEWPHTWMPSIFVRFYWCNLCCKWCDSRYAVDNPESIINTTVDEVVKEIKKLVPDVSSIFSKCEAYEELVDSVSSDTTTISIFLSEESIKFKSKGGEFKKIKVTSNTDDWEVLECPEWLTFSRNKNNEVIFESSKNDTKKERKGAVKIGCLGEIKEIVVIQM